MRISQTAQFKKDAKRQRKRGKDLQKIKDVVDCLVTDGFLPSNYKDHPLAGNWIGWRDCPLEPDWILIYKIQADEIVLARTGSHSDLF